MDDNLIRNTKQRIEGMLRALRIGGLDVMDGPDMDLPGGSRTDSGPRVNQTPRFAVSARGELPVFCSIHDSYGVFIATGIVEHRDLPETLFVARIRPVARLARCMIGRGQREFVLTLSGGSRYTGLVRSSHLVEETRRCEFLVLGCDRATGTLTQTFAFASSE